jgi:hypothetical protein
MISEPFVHSDTYGQAALRLDTDDLGALLVCLNSFTESQTPVRPHGFAQLWINTDDLGASR